MRYFSRTRSVLETAFAVAVVLLTATESRAQNRAGNIQALYNQGKIIACRFQADVVVGTAQPRPLAGTFMMSKAENGIYAVNKDPATGAPTPQDQQVLAAIHTAMHIRPPDLSRATACAAGDTASGALGALGEVSIVVRPMMQPAVGMPAP